MPSRHATPRRSSVARHRATTAHRGAGLVAGLIVGNRAATGRPATGREARAVPAADRAADREGPAAVRVAVVVALVVREQVHAAPVGGRRSPRANRNYPEVALRKVNR